VKNHFILSWVVVATALGLVGCASSPDAKFYTLNAIERNVAPTSPQKIKGRSIAVKVGPVTIPDTLDQSQIVTRSGSNRLVLDEFNRWGGDLQNDFQRLLGENISILLPTDRIILNQDVTLLPVDFQVIVNIREFDGQLAGAVTLNADWTVARQGKGKTVVAKKSVLQEKADGADYKAYVGAQSRLLARLSREIADEIRRQMYQ